MRAVDLFAGWGGFTEGAEAAGAQVVWAGNHWPLAVEAHAANHPHVAHVCQDLRQADWSALPEFDLLLASPACQGHSQAAQPARKAAGTIRTKHDALRATAWSVVDCADVTLPRAIVVENVPDFLRWRLYPVWRTALEALGYQLQEHVLTASHFGTPQRRSRVFVIATRKAIALDLKPSKEPAFGPHIQWDSGKWRSIEKARPKARERIDRARRNHGDRCIVQHVTGHKGLALSEPIRTITTQDQWAVIAGDRYRPLTVRETARAMGFPDSYAWPETATRRDQIRGLGNAVCPPQAKALIGAVMGAV